MAAHCAYVLQGKNSPHLKRNLIDHNQYAIIVNCDTPMVKGNRKMERKKYYKHTGWSGGLKTYKMRELVKKDSIKFMRRFIYGMLPKNEQTRIMLAHLEVFKGNYHNFDLPQFYPQFGEDPNTYAGLGKPTDDRRIVFFSDKEVPPELKDIKVELDPMITAPDDIFEPAYGRGKKHIYDAAQLESWLHKYKRYKTTRKN